MVILFLSKSCRYAWTNWDVCLKQSCKLAAGNAATLSEKHANNGTEGPYLVSSTILGRHC